MPAKTRKGRVHPHGGGPSKNATYYPRSDGGSVAETGPHAGKRVAVRSPGRDREKKSRAGKTISGYGHKGDKSGQKKRKTRKKR